MKTIIKLSFLLLALLLPATAIAYDFEVDGIYYNVNGNEASVTYKGSDPWSDPAYSGNVVIPPTVTYNGTTYSVTAIGEEAFAGCSGLISITVPNSVTSIGFCAFRACIGLIGITIPDSVTSIESGAFDSCSGLTNVILGNSVSEIYEYAFSYCNSLTSITIPNSVTFIGGCAFNGCI